MLEIEAKIEVQSHAPIRTRMSELNVPPRTLHERDIYYSPRDRDFGRTDEALRVRYANGSCSLTYKGPKVGMRGVKAREEVTVTIDNGENIEKILDSLGFLRVEEVQKRRELYEYRGATICLDEVDGLGTFIEIEVSPASSQRDPVATIQGIKEDLGISGEHISLSYLELLLLKRPSARRGYPSHSH